MATIGCLGDIVFLVSSDTVKTFEKMKWEGSARYATHQRHLSNALTEFTGIDPEGISFQIFWSAYLSVNPMKEMERIRSCERSGKPLPLVIGEKAYGLEKWTIRNHKFDIKTHDKDGNVTGATATINLLEYLSG